MITTQLDTALKGANVPIVGVSIGKADDKSTWRVDFLDSATDADRTKAAALVAAFVVADQPVDAAPLRAEDVLAWCATKLGVDPLTAALEVVSGEMVEDAKPRIG